jgi:dimethylhistidine N-methyltransferase
LKRHAIEDSPTPRIRDGTPEAGADRRFADDVRAGLGGDEKSLPCVYLYDARGSLLFERITLLPEYYLTRAEYEIIGERADEIARMAGDPVRVVELGSGSAAKAVTLLRALAKANRSVTYFPVDVCDDVLRKSVVGLEEDVPEVEVRPIRARYREGLASLPGVGQVLLFWLGSSIGNLDRNQAASFLCDVRDRLSSGDRMLIGIDLRKDTKTLEAAYNDSAGITAEFNLNLLRRINRELRADFELERFEHVACWNPADGRIEMYLESRSQQTVRIGALGMTVNLAPGERIHTENSYKYMPNEIEALADRAGVEIEEQWFDSGGLFSLHSLRVGGSSAHR